MTQRLIDYGAFPDDPSADAIRTAFQKVQNNFTELYNVTSNSAVLSIVQAFGSGITVNQPTGNVTITANIAQVQVRSSTLRFGINAPLIGTLSTITNGSQVLYIDIDPGNVFSANIGGYGGGTNLANITGTLSVASNTQPNLVSAPNLTTIGPLSSLSITGNLAVDNITASNSVVAANITGSFTTAAASQPNITSLGTLTGLTLSGPLSSTSTISTTSSMAADTITATTSITAPIFNGTATTASTVITAAQPNITSVGTLTGLTISGVLNSTNHITTTGNVTAANFIGNGAQLTDVVAAIAGTVSTNAQPNITSVGTLTSLTVSGPTNLGPIAGITITGGTNGQVLTTDGIGGLSWSTPSGSNIANGTSSVSIPTSSGNVNISSGGTANVIQVSSTTTTIIGTVEHPGITNINGLTYSTISTPNPALGAVDTTIAFKIPIVVNGTTYYIALTTAV